MLESWKAKPNYKKPIIHVRYVTKGTNRQQIIESCIGIKQSVFHDSLRDRAEWHLEVLSDSFINLGEVNRDVVQLVVPAEYTTPQNSLFKSRALHWASQHCEVDKDAWILHMDEEGYFNTENGHKIVDHCDNENYLIGECGQKHSFANGYIVYTKQDTPDSYFFTLIDTARIVDDRLKMSWCFNILNRCYLGIKGSCWIIHSEIERNVGFDVRYHRSIGEDWVASLNFNEAGYPVKWMDAVVEEQSPFNFRDFMKQRNRWQKANLHNAYYSIYDYTFPLSFMLYVTLIMYLLGPFALVGLCIGIVNMIGLTYGIVCYGSPIFIVPIIADSWYNWFLVIISTTSTLSYMIGYYHSGFSKYGRVANLLGWLFFATPIGPTISGICECVSLMNFILFVDKRSYEFKVINKDSRFDKYSLKYGYENNNTDDQIKKDEKLKFKNIVNQEVNL